MSLNTITLERRERVMLIGLNRPDKRNAFNLEMLRELAEAIAEYEGDDELWCALLFAHGEHFTGGLDLEEVGPAVAQAGRLFPENCPDPLDLGPYRRTKPLVVATQGWCLTIGIELCLAADIRVAANDTKFGQIEVKRGIFPFGGATIRLPEIAGWGNAMRWLLTGDTFDAEEARRIGLIQEVCEPGEQLNVALEIAQRVAKQAPLAVKATIRSARLAEEADFDSAVAELLPEARQLMATRDAQEGVRSFIERREARFTGE